VSFFDQPLRVTRFKLVHAVWRRQRMDVLPGVAPVSLLLARTDNTVVALPKEKPGCWTRGRAFAQVRHGSNIQLLLHSLVTDVRGYPDGFVFLLRLRWGLVADPYEQPPWPFPDWGSPDPLEDEPLPDTLLRFGEIQDGERQTTDRRGSQGQPRRPTDIRACHRSSSN
jgi:hypothetical protein